MEDDLYVCDVSLDITEEKSHWDSLMTIRVYKRESSDVTIKFKIKLPKKSRDDIEWNWIAYLKKRPKIQKPTPT